MKRFNINEQGMGSYLVADGKIASVDLNAAFGYNALGDLAKKAVAFAIGHVLRNATAGKMDAIDEAFKAVCERAKALSEGKWAAHKETGEAGEARESLLSRALARVMKCEPKDAAAFISGEIRTAMEEAGIDPDADSEDLTADEKSLRRKKAAEVRKAIAEDPAVAVALAQVKLEAATEKAQAVAKSAEGKASKFA